MKRAGILFFKLVLIGLACAGLDFAQTAYQVTLQRNVPVKMRDDVILRADIYRPKAEGKFPVLLERTPYNKDLEVNFGIEAAQRGYVFVVQDCRGRYASEGEWIPFKHESHDGYDTIEWAAALPYSNGKVGMVGGSYVGATQMLAAIASPPHLAGISPFVTASNYHANWAYQGGAFEQWFNESWATGLAVNTFERETVRRTNVTNWDFKLPVAEYPLLTPPEVSSLAPYFLDWIEHPAYDDYWKKWSIEEHYGDIKIPAFCVGAWYDIFLGGTLRNYLGIRDHGGTEAARTESRLMVIIGGHSGSGRKIGAVDFGPNADFNFNEIQFRWYDHLLKGIDNGAGSEKPVRIFVMGKNDWQDFNQWPPARLKETRYYFHSSGIANSLRGDGELSAAAPASEKPDKYIYDPADPVPTIGGPLCCDGAQLAPGPQGQRPDENRDDVLVYTTPPFTQDFTITGPVKVDLYASSSAVDTDFTAKLVDVWPNGFAQNLTEGILRARYRNSSATAEFLNPGEIYKFAIDLWATSNSFLIGHRLRVEISSSNFPRFSRNLNSGQDPETGMRFVKATNTIYHDAAHPSAIVLPVMPK
jgi:uncharacterized protein